MSYEIWHLLIQQRASDFSDNIIRKCHNRLTHNFLQHRSSSQNIVEISIETLFSFYISSFDLTEDNLFMNLINVSSNEQETANSLSNSKYANETQSHTWNNHSSFTEVTMLLDLDSFFNSTYNFSDSQLASANLNCLNVSIVDEKIDFSSNQKLCDESF